MKETRFESAKRIYASFGVDVEQALAILKGIPLSIHCWQGDDVIGFDGAGSLSGGIETTGNYPGRASTPEELFLDLSKALSLMPGKKRLNLHASYAMLGQDEGKVDRDCYTIDYYHGWIDFAKENQLDGIDFNPTFFAHPKVKDGLTLSSPEETTRKFWVEHGKRSLEITAELAKAFGKPALMDIWIPDGYKDVPADRLFPRLRLKKSLDEMLEGYDKKWVIPALESKVFGIGVESYTVGSSEFYLTYAAKKGVYCLLDSGHYHPTESIADKIPSLLCFYDKVALHLSRPVRWDSDHVVIFDDEMKEICKEIVRNGMLDKVIIGLDYFDASINRLSAWVTGERAVEKSLLYALLLPNEEMKRLQEKGAFTKLQCLQEASKTLPLGDVWDEYLRREGLSDEYYTEIAAYEKNVLAKRK
jgi:L-rhamnose isomerase